MFRRVPLSIIRSSSLDTQQLYMSYRIRTELVPSWSCSQAVSKPVWHIPLLCIQQKTPDDGQRNCPKRVEFYPKNKFEKLVHLVGFIIKIYVCVFACSTNTTGMSYLKMVGGGTIKLLCTPWRHVTEWRCIPTHLKLGFTWRKVIKSDQLYFQIAVFCEEELWYT